MISKKCKICKSSDIVMIDSYKHDVCLCCNCNGVSHLKKNGLYFLEMIGLQFLFFFLPRRAYQRLFHAKKTFKPSQFYDTYIQENKNLSPLRKAETKQILDQLNFGEIDIEALNVLDVSGGPGLVARSLKDRGANVYVTEFSEEAVRQIKSKHKVNAIKFDYSKDRLINIFETKFDLVLLRSSIIFCDDLHRLLSDIKNILNNNGHVLIETIIPSLGEIFWWQQMEFKFPVIYSQETILKIARDNDLSVVFGYRESDSYIANKLRAKKGFSYFFWSMFVDLPMVGFYRLKCVFKNIPIDSRLNHKMLTVLLKKGNEHNYYNNIKDFQKPQSTHFNISDGKIIDKLK